MALRILHQSINGKEHRWFLNDLENHRLYNLHLKDIDLKTVLDHVLDKKSDHNQMQFFTLLKQMFFFF